jgi:hypothetical protein
MMLPMTIPMMLPNTRPPVVRRRASRSGLDPSRMVTPSGTCYSGRNCDGKVLRKDTDHTTCCRTLQGKCWTSDINGQDYSCDL